MQSMLTVSNPEDTRVLYITVTYPDEKMAAEIANSYAEAAKTFIIKNMDMVGGIDIELTSAEADYINKRNDTSIVAGLNHLNGAETLTYARARKIDSDFGRTERQRKVLMAVYEQTKNLPASELFDLMNNALPYLTTDLTDSEILSLAYRLLPLASSISISSHTVPASDCYYSANIRGMSVLVPDLPLIRQRLEEYLPLE